MTRVTEESAKEWLVGAGWAYLAFAWFAFVFGLCISIREHGIGHALAQVDPTNLRSGQSRPLSLPPAWHSLFGAIASVKASRKAQKFS